MARRRSRRDQQSWLIWFKLFKLVVLLAGIGAAAFYAYEVGQRLALEQVAGLKQEIERLTGIDDTRKQEVAKLTADLDETKKRAEDFQSRYEQVAPSDDLKEVVALVRAKLAGGLDAKRLSYVISQAERPRRCGRAGLRGRPSPTVLAVS